MPNSPTVPGRRHFLKSSAATLAALSLKYASAAPLLAAAAAPGRVPGADYHGWEDVMRTKWTWDKVARGSRGINCTGHCAWNVYVKNGIVWREEQQGEYGRSGEDTPDYGPRGCQKGARHAKHMYGKQRVLYPMKRVGERGAGRWQRISWEQAANEIAAKVIEHASTSGPDSITYAMGTAMIVKRASFAALFRFANASGIVMPETFAGVGDLPAGAHMTLGYGLPCDTMAAVFKSKCVLVWQCNPAATRIPDAHFFWEAKYNGTEIVTIAPDFNATAIHSSKWLHPKPGTDAALAMSMVQVILAEGLIERPYVLEQTDLPFLVRAEGVYSVEPDREVREPGLDLVTRDQWLDRLDGLLGSSGTAARWRMTRFRTLRDGWFLECDLVATDASKHVVGGAHCARAAIEVDPGTGVVSLRMLDGVLHQGGSESSIVGEGYRMLLPDVTQKQANAAMQGMVVTR